MIENVSRWYHYLFIPFWGQFAICLICLLIIAGQIMVAETLDKYEVVFEGECTVTVGPENDEGEVREGALMQCGEDTRILGTLETPYFYQLLTYGEAPAILCVKEQTHLLESVRWTCNFEGDEEQV